MAKGELKLENKTDGEGFEGMLEQSEPGGLKVGFVKGLGKHPGSNTNIAEIAAYNEFGTENEDGSERIPERPFLRTTIVEQNETYKTIVKELLVKILTHKMETKQAIGLLGIKAVSDVKAKITAISEPPNADSTKAGKKSSNPLIDTGLMRQSVTWEEVD